MRKFAFVIIKPDSISNVLDVNILEEMKGQGLQPVIRKFALLSDEDINEVYPEKRNREYFDELKNFFKTGQSLCMVVKSTNNEDVELSIRNFKEYIRKKYAVIKYSLPDIDRELYEKGVHPRQNEIKQELSFRNIMHSTSDPEIVGPSIKKVFSESEMLELKGEFPDLYYLWNEAEIHNKLVRISEPNIKII